MNKKTEIEKLNNQIRKCKKCPLWKTRKNTVPGEGPVDARVMIIGEAAGGKEDETGRPFCGPAGKILDEFLRKAKIDRKQIYITSILKCRPVISRIKNVKIKK